VVKFDQGFDFRFKTVPEMGIVGIMFGKYFNGLEITGFTVLGSVDGSHATSTENTQQFVRT
jgi:hypothetical protein